MPTLWKSLVFVVSGFFLAFLLVIVIDRVKLLFQWRQQHKEYAQTLEYVSNDPNFRVPFEDLDGGSKAETLSGKEIPMPQAEDRR